MDNERSGHALDDFSRRLYQALSTAASLRTNETELREDAEPVIWEALEKLYGMSALSFTAERKSRRGGHRHYDKLYGGVVVEWEWGGEVVVLVERSRPSITLPMFELNSEKKMPSLRSSAMARNGASSL